MNNKSLQDKISDVENLIEIQRASVSQTDPSMDYMHGMLNGLICAHSVFANCTPKYHRIYKKNRSKKVRHKTIK